MRLREQALETAADQLRAARELAGLNQAQAARACGKYPPGWHDWESGKRVPSPRALAGALAVLLAAAARRWREIARQRN